MIATILKCVRLISESISTLFSGTCSWVRKRNTFKTAMCRQREAPCINKRTKHQTSFSRSVFNCGGFWHFQLIKDNLEIILNPFSKADILQGIGNSIIPPSTLQFPVEMKENKAARLDTTWKVNGREQCNISTLNKFPNWDKFTIQNKNWKINTQLNFSHHNREQQCLKCSYYRFTFSVRH